MGLQFTAEISVRLPSLTPLRAWLFQNREEGREGEGGREEKQGGREGGDGILKFPNVWFQNDETLSTF